jgi:hypothetical protein
MTAIPSNRATDGKQFPHPKARGAALTSLTLPYNTCTWNAMVQVTPAARDPHVHSSITMQASTCKCTDLL